MADNVMVWVNDQAKVKFDRVKEKIEAVAGSITKAKVFIAALDALYDLYFDKEKIKETYFKEGTSPSLHESTSR